MYHKVLVPLDGSSLAESVLDQAKSLVFNCKVLEMILITIVEPFRDQPFRTGDDWVIKMQKEAAKYARNYLDQLVERLKTDGIQARAVVTEGDPAQEIMDYARKNGVDLIIMNSHGKSGLSRWVFGSVANKVVLHSTVPVLIIPVTSLTPNKTPKGTSLHY